MGVVQALRAAISKCFGWNTRCAPVPAPAGSQGLQEADNRTYQKRVPLASCAGNSFDSQLAAAQAHAAARAALGNGSDSLLAAAQAHAAGPTR